MNLSSPTTFEMREDEMYPTSCYNCTNDCMGIFGIHFGGEEDE